MGFDKGHRQQLGRLGVTAQQMEKLERVLHLVAATTQQVAVAEIRMRIDPVVNAAHTLSSALVRMDRGEEAADRVAAWLLYEAHSDQEAEDLNANPLGPWTSNPDPESLCSEIQRLEKLARSVMQKIEGTQSRLRLASPRPIGWIDDALLVGWVRTHEDCSPLPEYPFGAKASGPFREIVSICYQAAGHPTEDPERAIKTYLRSKRRSEAQP